MNVDPHLPVLHRLTRLDDLETVLAASATHPVLLFKHSGTCGTSALAKEEIEDWLAAETTPGVVVYIVDVHRARVVALAIAERLRIRHESPQVLLLRNGGVTWHASHFGVSADSIRKALSRSHPGLHT